MSNCNILSIDYTAVELASSTLKDYFNIKYKNLIEKSHSEYISNSYLYNTNILCNYIKSEFINSTHIHELKHINIEDGITNILCC
jgi:hypothetical protein